jgi:hypothetical protein
MKSTGERCDITGLSDNAIRCHREARTEWEGIGQPAQITSLFMIKVIISGDHRIFKRPKKPDKA